MEKKNNTGASAWIDPDDAPELTEEFFANGQWSRNGVPIPTPPKRGRPKAETTKVAVSLRLDANVVDHFRKQGSGWQTRLNDILRDVMLKEDHELAAPRKT
jgi:uncharacterized protein (DUF4415 family)